MTGWFFEPLRPLFYELAVIDPPWHYELRSAKGEKKSAHHHYKSMPDAQILAMPVGQLVSMHSLIYLWVTAPRLDFGIQCLKAWGFRYKSFLVWRKVTKNGKVRMGPGYRVRTTAELILVGTLGNPRQHVVPQSIIDGVAREHSRKPEEFYELCDRIAPHMRRCDIFARQSREGWDTFGDEAAKFDEPAPPRLIYEGRP